MSDNDTEVFFAKFITEVMEVTISDFEGEIAAGNTENVIIVREYLNSMAIHGPRHVVAATAQATRRIGVTMAELGVDPRDYNNSLANIHDLALRMSSISSIHDVLSDDDKATARRCKLLLSFMQAVLGEYDLAADASLTEWSASKLEYPAHLRKFLHTTTE